MKQLSALLFILGLSGAALTAHAQKESTPGLSPLTRHYLEELKKHEAMQPEGYIYRSTNGRQYVSAMIKVTAAGTAQEQLSRIGAQVDLKAGDIWTVQVPVDQVLPFTRLSGISYIQLDEPVFPKLDQARRTTRVDSVHKGINLPLRYSGKNVVVGVIDFGFDYNHPTFYDTLGTSFRIRKVWELNSNGTPPAGFTYGRELGDTTTIKASTTDNALQTHGTSVAGMAAGSGYGSLTNNRFRGMAYDADLVLVGVRRDTIASQWMQGGFSDFANGIGYILNYATSVSKPAVVNISWGSQSGAHDGTSLFNQACDNLSGPGKIIVMSAGNEGQEHIHLQKQFSPTDTLIRTHLTFSPATYQRTWVDIWGEPAKSWCSKATLYRNGAEVSNTGYVCLDNAVHSMYILGSNGTDTCYVEFINSLAEPNGKPRMTINVFNKTTDTVSIAVKAGEGMIHMWNEYYYYGYTHGYQSAFSKLGQSWATEGDTLSTVSDMGAANSVLLVGAYVSKLSWTNINGLGYGYSGSVNRLAGFSSRGPMVDGRIKPDIAAPGLTIATAVNSYDTAYTATGTESALVRSGYTNTGNGRTYYYSEFSGTSAASPAAAGIVALMLQVNPNLTPAQTKTILFETAITDTYTGTIPSTGDISWGHGKINAYGAIRKLVQQTGIYNYAGTKKLDCVLFPNPGTGNFTLDYSGQRAEALQLEVYSVTGVKALTEAWPVSPGTNQRGLNLSALSKGTYIVKVTGREGSVSIQAVLN